MKYSRFCCITFFAVVLAISGLGAETRPGMSLSGATGLYSIPTGRIGWERGSGTNFGLDFGYHAIIHSGNAAHIPKVAMSFFNFLELSAAFDIRPEDNRGNDFITGAKIQLPLTRTALALGGNYQFLYIGQENRQRSAWQLYIAATYSGHFFDMPAETTIVIGRTFIEGHSNSNIDFGMGFDMMLFPGIFEGLIHWITDFANFSYSVSPYRANAWYRGVLNTGIRLNLSMIPAFRNLRFTADIMVVDAFDQNRSFSTGLTLGIPMR